ncbi:MAG TPA: hypothetical protein DCO72_09845 [Ruminococcus sp.]|nr:hypothetical protein [Ruminococcus sp.]
MGGILSFIQNHVFGLFCIAGLIWLIKVVFTQIQYKKNGILLQAEIIDDKVVNGNFFAVYKFEHMGQEIVIDSYNGDKSQHTMGQVDAIYYLEGNSKGVFREQDVKIQLWEIVCFVSAIVFGLIEFGVLG